ncbi:hypothetical protein HO133_002937 [Letharia lupina]|uniref:NAD(P)-binding domain-containing protein n=1 Tax=Letharia lupina TaxID=560253 RepID=A0A8H6FAD1_9LECA|nr:uncharacterized protein HO133_002937 [Letharia lupina]KAF6220504.1 hypothetical protein HO133_002937 [Letharia lupina]
MTNTKPLLAFYGATGGSTLAALVPALKAGYDCTALVRTPSKLTALLLEKGVPQSALDTHLTISKGDVLNTQDCRGTLTLNGRTADIIISGIGVPPTGPEITVCTTTANNILSALPTLPPTASGTKPLFVALSTTGVSDGPRDVPLLFAPLYHWFLANPHRDKRNMERAIGEQTDNFVIVRPSLLTNGKAQGGRKIRVGTEGEPVVGYVISREDVGLWMFENLVQGDGARYVGQKVIITH